MKKVLKIDRFSSEAVKIRSTEGDWLVVPILSSEGSFEGDRLVEIILSGEGITEGDWVVVLL